MRWNTWPANRMKCDACCYHDQLREQDKHPEAAPMTCARPRTPIPALLYETSRASFNLRDRDHARHGFKYCPGRPTKRSPDKPRASHLWIFSLLRRPLQPPAPSTPAPALLASAMTSSVSVRRLVALFDSPATFATVTRAAAAISRTRVSDLVQVYEPTLLAAVDEAAVAPSCAVATPTRSPVMSIVDIDNARFAAFGYPHDPSANSYLRYTTTATTATTSATDAIDIPASITATTPATSATDAIGIATSTTATATTTSASDAIGIATSTTTNPTMADAAASSSGPTPASRPASTAYGVDQLDTVHDRASGQRKTSSTCPWLPKDIDEKVTRRSARSPRRPQSRLLQYQDNPAFLRKCWQARQRRAAAAASKKIWKP
ncbi:unnamed protein product [Phytophthora fragariaefolia]|uniref:Unnamed protein product n=1 Tax=Phytophthora fragariaefolia TaxID=1490495 RepID=A0A9W6TRA3_9STRA|nr:unnamed protein product [Phytophthora fragariaefolia]